VNVVVFFSYGMSLANWVKLGIYSREIERYRRLGKRLGQVTFVTYDRTPPRLEGLDDFVVLGNRFGLPHLAYSVLAPLLHWRTLRTVNVLMTHQISGALTGVLAKWLCRKPLIVRVGYFLGDLLAVTRRAGWTRLAVRMLEWVAYRAADGILSTSDPTGRPGFPTWQRLAVIPNGVNTDVFRPGARSREEGDPVVCYVGRLSAREKNLRSLVEAVRGLGVRLVVVGDGPERVSLEEQARRNGLAVTFLGFVPNERIPAILNAADVFVLPSLSEGNPKVLLEAMACGLPVVSSRWRGAERIVHDGENGIMCDFSPEGIRAAVVRLLGDEALRRRLGAWGRAWAVRKFAIDRIVEREAGFVEAAMGGLPPAQARRVRWIASRVRGGRVLDIGFAGAREPYLHRYIKERATVVGLDIEEAQVRKHCFPLSVVGDGFALPFRGEAFDLVVLAEVIEHLETPGPLMVEAIRVLRPGGTLLLTTPSPYSLTRWLRHYLLNANPSRPRFWQGFLGDEDHRVIWEPLSLCAMIERRGVTVTELQTLELSVPLLGRRRLMSSLLSWNTFPLNRISSFTCLAARKSG